MTIANQSEYDAWNGESGQRWVADPDRHDRVMDRVADVLLDAAALAPGEAVVDIGCGCGATTLAAARTVGPRGPVLGIDISATMLDVARQRTDAAGLSNVTFVQADVQTQPFAAPNLDIAISRFGTMFFDDPVAAFSNVARALRKGGRLCVASWQSLVANEWLTVPGAVLLRYGSIPETGDGPGMFAQSDPGIVASVLAASGFHAVDVLGTTVALRLGSDAEEAMAHLADTGVGRAVLSTVPEHDRAAALDAVTEVLADHATDDGVFLDAAIWITTATV